MMVAVVVFDEWMYEHRSKKKGLKLVFITVIWGMIWVFHILTCSLIDLLFNNVLIALLDLKL